MNYEKLKLDAKKKTLPVFNYKRCDYYKTLQAKIQSLIKW